MSYQGDPKYCQNCTKPFAEYSSSAYCHCTRVSEPQSVGAAPREWWLVRDPCADTYNVHTSKPEWSSIMLGNERVHVVEHSGYLALEAELEFLKNQRAVFLRTRQESINEQDAERERLTAEVEVSRQWELEHLERAENAERKVAELEAMEAKYKLEINSHAAEGEVVWARVTDLEAKLKRELALSERLRAALTDILHEGNLATQGKWDATHEIKALAYKALERGE